jgi:hypothetical protein
VDSDVDSIESDDYDEENTGLSVTASSLRDASAAVAKAEQLEADALTDHVTQVSYHYGVGSGR